MSQKILMRICQDMDRTERKMGRQEIFIIISIFKSKVNAK